HLGTIDIAAGATLQLTDSLNPVTHRVSQGASITGGGQVIFGGEDQNTLTIDPNASLRVPNFSFQEGGTISGGGQLSAARFEWWVGTINTPIFVGATDWLQIGGDGQCVLENVPLVNLGTVDWVGTRDFLMRRAASISNNGAAQAGIFN